MEETLSLLWQEMLFQRRLFSSMRMAGECQVHETRGEGERKWVRIKRSFHVSHSLNHRYKSRDNESVTLNDFVLCLQQLFSDFSQDFMLESIEIQLLVAVPVH